MGHAVAQLLHRSAAFLFAHGIQPLDTVFQGSRYLLLQSSHGIAVFGGIQSARQLEHRIQVGLGADAELFGDVAEGAQIAAYQLAIHRKRGPAATLQAERDFDVAAMQPVLQHAADFHLHRIQFDRQPQVQIQEPVVDRLQA